MVFSSPSFLFYFLPITLAFYFFIGAVNTTRIRGRNVVLLFFSLVFYFYGSGKYVVLVLAITLSSYIFGLLINTAKKKRFLFIVSVSFPLLLLFIFKYANFFTHEMATLASMSGLPPLPHTSIILPIGISFYTFQCLSYIIDVYLKKEKPERSFFNLLLYIIMFPQLIAGPIVRYSTVTRQLPKRKESLNDFSRGAVRFVYGLSKKVLIADACGLVADTAYNVPLDKVSTSVALIGSFAYFLQIYFDFSAYSDMAIGLGRIFGFNFPENFNRPYSSSSVTEFWRRWHITLSSWFRDYVYFPLGGSQKGALQTYRNLWIVFLCTGIWHGANWTFILWGAYHGALLSVERFFNLRVHHRFRTIWRIATILCVYLGWIMFRSTSLSQAITFYSHIFHLQNWDMDYTLRNVMTHKNISLMLLGVSSIFFPENFVVGTYLEHENSRTAMVARGTLMTLIMLFSLFVIASNNYSPFLYFRF